jgi:thioredoxin 1
MVAPIIDELADEYEGKVVIGKCDVEEGDEVAAQFMIRNVPTIIFIKDGKQVDKHVGAATKDQLKAKIEAML